MAQVVRLDLVSTVTAGFELGYARGVDVEADHRRALPAESDGDGEPDISEADDGELSTVRHDLPWRVRIEVGSSYPADIAVRNDHSGRSFEQTSIEPDQVAPDALARELQRDQLAAGGAEPVPKLAIE